MTLRKKNKHYYGDTLEDLEQVISDYSKRAGYAAAQYRASRCEKGHDTFYLDTDEDEGVARRTCTVCGAAQFMGDGAEYAEGAELGRHECLCGKDALQLLSGVALYEGSRDVRWFYLGCRCPDCGLCGVYADWKCEAGDAGEFLAKV